MKFKNNIELQAGLEDLSGSTGTPGQLLSSTETGTSWIAQDDIISAASKLVVIACKNTHSATISKGTPVYQTGTVGATDVIEIAPADALISLGHQPAVGLLQQDLAINEFGNVVITGELLNFTTDPIDGLTPVTGQKVFLKSGGGLTLTKPTGVTNGIQNLGLIGKVSGGNSGSITVSSIMRTNDVPNLTTGKIWVGDGNTVESTVVHLDEVNGRMGIGTTSPSSKLNVSSASFNDHITLTRSSDELGISVSGGQLMLEGGASPFNDINEDLGRSDKHWREAFVYSLRSGGVLQFKTNGNNERMRITSTGNVGIGDTDPQAKLHINRTTLGEYFRGGSGGLRELRFSTYNTDSDHAGHKIDASSGNGEITLATGGSSRVTVDNTGNVGIGTTDPTSLLEISKQLSAASTIDYPYTISSRDDGNSINQQGGEGVGIKFRIAGNDATTPGNSLVGASIAAIREMHGDTDSSTGLGFFITQNDETLDEALRIDHDGNVGIGATSPGAKLDVNGDVLIKSGEYISWGTVGATSIEGSTASNKLQFRTNSSDRMIIDSTGNVGIGTTSPTDYGTTANTLEVRGASGTGTGLIRVSNADNTVGTSLYSSSSAGTLNVQTNHPLTFATNNNEKMRIDSAGNVGIGTTNPGSKLQVGENTSGLTGTTSIFQEGGAEVGLYVKARVNRASILVADNDTSVYVSAEGGKGSFGRTQGVSTANINIDGSGNVGIGTINPAYKLHVNGGDAQIANGSTATLYMNNSNNYLYGDVNGVGIVAAGNNFRVKTNNSERLRIIQNGNVGIGTTSPSEKLDVVGNIKLNGVLYIGSRGIYQQENTDVSGLELVANASTSLYRAAFFDYVIQKAGNVRAGTVFACNDGGSVEYTETSTNDIGDTSDVVLSVDISGGNMRLLADAATSGWSVKSLIRAI